MDTSKEKIRNSFQFFFDIGENASQATENLSTVSIAQELKIAQKTFQNHLHQADLKKRSMYGYHTQKTAWIEFPSANRNTTDPFLKLLVIGDEYDTYDNVKRKRSRSIRGNGDHDMTEIDGRNVLLCVWWEWQGIIYYELLPYDATVNLELYCQQLGRLKQAIAQKRPALANKRRIVFHQDIYRCIYLW